MIKIAEQTFEDPVMGLVIQFRVAADGSASMYLTGMGEEENTVADMIRKDGLTRDYAFGEDGRLAGCGTFMKPPTGPIDGS